MSIAPYRPRRFSQHGLWEIDDLKFKVYGIARRETQPLATTLLNNARAYLDLTLPGLRQLEGDDHGLGYVIVHAGEMSNWLLAHWWAHQDIALRLLASADIGSTQFKSEDHRRFHACVWEHVVIDHERDAWVSSLMSEGTPDDYLNDRLADGDY